MKFLIVVDAQKDFTYGALKNEEAIKVLPKISEKIKKAREEKKQIIFTRDTHDKDYLNTQEGTWLPIPHCIEGSDGWQIVEDLWNDIVPKSDVFVDKGAFGCNRWNEVFLHFSFYEKPVDEIELVGFCTDICVISNAILLKALFPEIVITVDGSCCAGTTIEKHAAALEVLKSCQIRVI